MKIKDDIFSNIDNSNFNIPSKFEEIFRLKNFRQICLAIYEEEYFRKDFKKIGRKIFDHNDNKICLEIYIRVNEKYNKKHLEFILNDVSKMKEFEESKADLKFQSIFLKKVSHEFKNPFIGIISLIDEILEKKDIINHLIETNLNNVKNLTVYMMMLVKDFESWAITSKNRH